MRIRPRLFSRFYTLTLAGALLGSPGSIGQPGVEHEPILIEVFTTSEHLVERPWVSTRPSTPTIVVYALDAIYDLEKRLSKDLDHSPERAKAQAQRRLQSLNNEDSEPLKKAALGLMKVQQYGLDRYPALVVDQQFVLFGLTDISGAVQRVRAWRDRSTP